MSNKLENTKLTIKSIFNKNFTNTKMLSSTSGNNRLPPNTQANVA